MAEEFDPLQLDSQLCFPLYAAAKKVVGYYEPFLKELDLTYTQYIAMLVLWEKKETNVKDLGKRLHLDSGTLTPLLKKLEAKGYIKRTQSRIDARYLNVYLTKKGASLREKALSIPQEIGKCVNISLEDAITLRLILDKII